MSWRSLNFNGMRCLNKKAVSEIAHGRFVEWLVFKIVGHDGPVTIFTVL
jgi:hypothetical protein